MTRNCDFCKAEYSRPPSLVGKFCSRKCLGLSRKKRGGTFKSWNGYIKVYLGRDHPWVGKYAQKGGYIFEHRLVMARKLGRPIEKHESIHHVNGNTLDNRPENLQLRTRHGNGQKYRCSDCGSENLEPIML